VITEDVQRAFLHNLIVIFALIPVGSRKVWSKPIESDKASGLALTAHNRRSRQNSPTEINRFQKPNDLSGQFPVLQKFGSITSGFDLMKTCANVMKLLQVNLINSVRSESPAFHSIIPESSSFGWSHQEVQKCPYYGTPKSKIFSFFSRKTTKKFRIKGKIWDVVIWRKSSRRKL